MTAACHAPAAPRYPSRRGRVAAPAPPPPPPPPPPPARRAAAPAPPPPPGVARRGGDVALPRHRHLPRPPGHGDPVTRRSGDARMTDAHPNRRHAKWTSSPTRPRRPAPRPRRPGDPAIRRCADDRCTPEPSPRTVDLLTAPHEEARWP